MTRVRHPDLATDVVAIDPAMQRVTALCAKAARTTHSILIEGEAGTGKALLARAIHGASDRAAKPFVVLNCATTPWDRLEASLFGTQRGDGASEPGKLHAARGGTLLLKEIGDLPAAAQARLLVFLDTGEIPAGPGSRRERLDVRLIASSSRRLLNLARAGELGEQLFYRLNVLPITVPPLRERPADIASFAARFIAHVSAETGTPVSGISPEALALLRAHAWPGNVRELDNAVYRAAALAGSRRLEPVDFPHIMPRDDAAELARALATPSAPVHLDAAIPSRKHREAPAIADRFLTADGQITSLAMLERDLIAFAIEKHSGSMSKIARALGIGRSTLYRKLRDHGLDGGIRSNAV